MPRTRPGSGPLRQRRSVALENLQAHINTSHVDNPEQLNKHKEEIKKLTELIK